MAGASSRHSGWNLVALLPVGLVGLGAALPSLRIPVLATVVAGCAASSMLGRRPDGGDVAAMGSRGAGLSSPWAWAAPLPIATLLAWGLIPAPLASPDGSDCGSALSPPAVWRIGEAAIVLLVLAALAFGLRSSRAELGLRRPSTAVVALSVVGLAVVAPLSVVLGPWFARPFFGEVQLPGAGNLAAVVPAMGFALANGTMEELAYRGALLGWLGRVVGPAAALVVQALLFGLQHSIGAEFVGSSAPVVVAMVGGGLVAGLLVRRTGSISLPVALHVAFDVPLYYYWACRF